MTALRDYSSRLLASARNTLEAANNSPFEICSPQDLAYQRKLVFAAYHIKDIGRLRDDQLICSTLLSDIKTQPRRSVANDNLKDGTYIYADDALITPGSHGPIIGRGNANVVLSSVAFDLLHTPRYAFSIFATDEEKKHFALLYNYSGNAEPGPEPSSGDWAQKFVEAPDGKVLRENSCDPDTGVCISLSATIDRTSTAARLKNLLAICLGALAGGSVGLGWLYYRNRDHSLLYRLNKALAAGEPHLLYQPVVDMADGKVLGFEALIRWEIRKGDFVPPDVFVARAEEAGTATKITIYVLERLIEDMGDTLRQRRDLRININITASDLQSPAFMSRMERRLAAADIEPQQVGLELTERTAVDFPRRRTASGACASRGTGFISTISAPAIRALPISANCMWTQSRSTRLSRALSAMITQRSPSFRRSFPWRRNMASISWSKGWKRRHRPSIFVNWARPWPHKAGFLASRCAFPMRRRWSLQ